MISLTTVYLVAIFYKTDYMILRYRVKIHQNKIL